MALPQVLEKALPTSCVPILQAWKELPPGLIVFEPLKTVLIEFGNSLQLSVMKAFALPPELSLVNLKPEAPWGVTTTAVVEHVLVPPVVTQGGSSGTAHVAGHEAMHRPIWPGSPNRQLASQVLMQSAEAKLAVVMAASPAIDATNRFIFFYS